MASPNHLNHTALDAIPPIFEGTRAAYEAGVTKPVSWRMQQLKALRQALLQNKEAFNSAIRADLGRPELECMVAEFLFVLADLDHTIAHLHEWIAAKSVSTPGILMPATGYVQPEPLGVVLIIGAWNYPLQLTLCPLIAAIAAGNAAIVKPSELAHASAAFCEHLMRTALDNNVFRVVQGGVHETTRLLEFRFDHIFYTGNGMVAKHILRAAANHLTPTTLELGGKSPVLVDRDANLPLAVRRIAIGKFMNVGQTCLAPDYVLVHKDVAEKFNNEFCKALREFYGDEAGWENNPDLARMINERHWRRVHGLLHSAGGKVVIGGQHNASTRFFAPTLIETPSLESPIMQEEIFGPLLPIVTVNDMTEAVRFVNARPKPLALYVFSSSSKTAQKVLDSTTSGGACVNDTVVHCANPDLPFGGVGDSGMGAYHGKYGFDILSHLKPVLTQPTWIDTGALRYPPYTASKVRTLTTLFRWVPNLPSFAVKDVLIAGLTVAVIVLAVKYSQR